ncbi:MAG: transcription elongation factor GreA [Chloroflexi bacterium]|nr:transcription elongation factor GreA [Chloroflexota bacterium]
MTSDVIYLTQEGYAKIREELAYLKNVKRPDVSDKLQKAIAEGDLRENANYHDAKEQQGFLEGRIMDLEESLRRAQLIQDEGPTGKVRIGSTVTIVEVGDDAEEVYRIVGVHEASPVDGLISNESPIGRALLGAKKGQVVTAVTPRGETKFKVLKIE